jgi:hypothetical protein
MWQCRNVRKGGVRHMRFEVLSVLKILILVFWLVTPYEIVGRYQQFVL